VPTPDPAPDDDDRLLRRLGTIAEVVDPVPDHVLAAGRALFAFRDPDAELLTAVAVDSDRLEAVRGTAPTSRMHFFQFDHLSIDLEVTSDGDRCGLVGVLVDEGPGAAGTPGLERSGLADASVTVDTPAAAFTTALDADGRFTVTGVPRGVARITLWRADRTRLATPWFEIGWPTA
jgi:hypothetical protein